MSGLGIRLRKRVLLLFFGVTLALLGLAVRLFWIQFLDGPALRQRAASVRTRAIPVEPKRGAIVDRKGRELAISINADTVVANPAEVRDPRRTAQQLAEVLGGDAASLERILTRRSAFEYVRRKIRPEQARRLRSLQLPGVYLTQESERVYPNGPVAAHVLGFVGVDSQGLAGVEVQYDRELRGVPGNIVVEYDARNQQIPQSQPRYVQPRDGLSLQLTLDQTIQYILERELERAVVQWNPLGAWGAVMDPRSGEILALAVRPAFDPNDLMAYIIRREEAGADDARQELWRNRFISDAFPPGSVFKPITAAAGIDTGKLLPSTPFFDRGFIQVLGHRISNWNGVGLGSTDFAHGFAESANTIFAQAGLMVGKVDFYRYVEAFGLTEPTGIDLPGEGIGVRPPLSRATDLDLALMAFGQTLTVTPVQMMTAIAAIANGGQLVVPHVARAFLDAEGRVVRRIDPPPRRRVISERTARTVRALMAGVVTGGTGEQARIPGYSVGGKTGTSQKVVGGRVVPGKNIASFIGFAPVDEPKVLVYIMVDEPRGIPYGGQVAAPVFRAVMQDVLRYLGVPPDQPEALPGDTLPSPSAAGAPPAGAPSNGAERVAVPDVVNLTVDEARQELAAVGLELLPA
ncbi:MAG: peptidoglycan glycosyltransferase, partial [Clostridia bacterium]|nr:peptidoglycan glycosyltransferase [Clostridia bacterium]